MKCNYVDPTTGKQCESHAMKDGSGLCFFHGPKDRVREAAVKGANLSHSKRDEVEIEPVKLDTMEDVLAIHERAIAVMLHQLELHPSDTKTAGNLSLALHRYAQAKDLMGYEKKLKELEARLDERDKTG